MRWRAGPSRPIIAHSSYLGRDSWCSDRNGLKLEVPHARGESRPLFLAAILGTNIFSL